VPLFSSQQGRDGERVTRGVFDKSQPIGRFKENRDGIVGFQHTLNISAEPLAWFQRWNYFLVQCVSCWLLQCLYKLAVNRSFLVNRFPEDR